jgi:exopolysaccharide biosynthesis WecB/TagA/CpsF family protein
VADRDTVRWPPKYDIFGVNVSATTYEELLAAVTEAVRKGVPAIVAHMPVHGLVAAVRDEAFRTQINGFDVVAPDGQPVRWALAQFHDVRLQERVYGPEFMARLCARAAQEGFGIYLYGSRQDVLDRLATALTARFAGLRIAGREAPPFRPLTPEEDAAAVARVNGSGAAVVFVGLGCPKQEAFAYEHRGRIRAVQVCVGAAFDFHAGHKRMAPSWMQGCGLEWLHRLLQEPGRLGWRYLWTNTVFLFLAARRWLHGLGRLRVR